MANSTHLKGNLHINSNLMASASLLVLLPATHHTRSSMVVTVLPRDLPWVTTHHIHSAPLPAPHQDSMELLQDRRQDNSVPRKDPLPVNTVSHSMVLQRNMAVVPPLRPQWAMFLVKSPPWTCLVKLMICEKP
jgi:hypothetical protein